MIRGPEGTEVVLGLRRGDETFDLPLERSRIEISAVTYKIDSSEDERRVGYIRLKTFNARAAREMREATKTLEDGNVEGYVLDLRGNPGGLLEASIDIARQWLNEGIIVSTKTQDGISDVRRATGSALTEKPLVVLIDQGSASASEIIAGAFQDNGRAELVGQKTYGKGLVQAMRALSDGSGLTVTVAKYLTPNGTDIHKHGIEPDVKSEISKKQLEKFKIENLGTKEDSQYVAAKKLLFKNLY